jgi:glutamate formiminotransferase
VNYEVTGMGDAYLAVRREAGALGIDIESTEIVGLVPRNALDREAEALGVEIDSAEIVGLVPRNALDREAEYFRKLANFSEATILENQIEKCYRDG